MNDHEWSTKVKTVKLSQEWSRTVNNDQERSRTIKDDQETFKERSRKVKKKTKRSRTIKNVQKIKLWTSEVVYNISNIKNEYRSALISRPWSNNETQHRRPPFFRLKQGLNNQWTIVNSCICKSFEVEFKSQYQNTTNEEKRVVY